MWSAQRLPEEPEGAAGHLQTAPDLHGGFRYEGRCCSHTETTHSTPHYCLFFTFACCTEPSSAILELLSGHTALQNQKRHEEGVSTDCGDHHRDNSSYNNTTVRETKICELLPPFNWGSCLALLLRTDRNLRTHRWMDRRTDTSSHITAVFLCVSELTDEDNSTAVMYRTISDLPMANRDTLAFLMLHLHR